ncbi:MAG: hypothetical protein AAF789_02465 [Bacteroidota bacterium]
MKKLLSITTIFVLAIGVSFGQGYAFRVLANKGQNKVKKAGASAAVPLKTGATLSAGDELIASKGAYIGLMHKSGKTLEVRTPGTKKVSDLAKLVNTKTTSITSRYAKFLADKMNEKETTNYRQRLNATGAATRGDDGDIIVSLIKDEASPFIGENIIIVWDEPEGTEEEASYIMTIKDQFDEIIYQVETAETKVNLDFTADQMQAENDVYIIEVSLKGPLDVSSDVYAIQRLTGDDASEYIEGLEALASEVEEESPLGKVIYASYFEEQGLVLDALTALEEAIQMSPEVEDFKVMKKDVMDRKKIQDDRN